MVFDTSQTGLDGLELAAQLARAQGRFPVVVVVAGRPAGQSVAEAAPRPETPTPEPSGGERYETGIWVTGRRGAMRIGLGSIACFTADRDYVRVRADGGEHLIRLPMRNLLQRLDPAQFVRVHRSAIVNRERVQRIERCPGGMLKIVLDTGLGVPVARRYLKAVKAALLAAPAPSAPPERDETAAGLVWA
ncbi:MAG: LytTR family transcriptional regulator [Proteobacteria bacterium]|nr:LytTR family transcriptional regulator [Pseudomonadota bacterium]